jgi:hypothetical protein
MFELEVEMYPDVLSSLPGALAIGEPVLFARELNLAYRRVDLALLPVDDAATHDPLLRPLRRLDHRGLWCLSVLACLADLRSDDSLAFGQHQSFLESIQPYVPALAARLMTHDAFAYASELSELVWSTTGSLVLVELKLERWRQAFAQASFNSRLGDGSCVVLSENAMPAVNEARFREAGLGLFSASGKGLKQIVSPVLTRRTVEPKPFYNKLRAIADASSPSPRKWQYLTC